MIAVGGGGFTHQSDPGLEDFILARCRGAAPAIGYIGAANRDRSDRIDWFYQRFAGRGTTSHLPQDATASAAADWATAQDIVYIAGGDTGLLLRFLREKRLAGALLDAAKNGTILAGVSAGAVCWFEFALSNAGGNHLGPLPGLGLIGGSCCPHYSSEAERQPVFRREIALGSMPAGIAIDDGAAVLLQHDRPPQAFSARHGAGAYWVAGESSADVALPLLNLD